MAVTTLEGDVATLTSVWRRLGASGTADEQVAQLLKIGLDPFLDAFSRRHLGAAGTAQGTKLVLGKNGEGKTHLLYCFRELALREGHAVAMLDPKTATVGDSPLGFAQEVLRSLETSEVADLADGGMKIQALLRAALDRKRNATLSAGLNPDVILPRWCEAMRDRNLQPFGLGDALADGLKAALEDDSQRLREAAAEVTFENRRYSRRDADREGSRLLQSVPQLVRALEFRPLVILLDEAETAVEHRGHARRLEFLKFLRFLNDHVAGMASDGTQALVVIACTDELWPQKFQEYAALHSRLADPGCDSIGDRTGLEPRALARKNKVWVQETFRGELADYEALGHALLDLADRVYPDVRRQIQDSNVSRFAAVASSNALRKQVKRTFIKALCSFVEAQVEDDDQRVASDEQVAAVFATAARAILDHDEAL